MNRVWNAWTPLKTCVGTSEAVLSVSRRTYTFRESAFPVSLLIDGEEFFSRPPVLTASFGEDKVTALSECTYRLYSADEERSLFRFSSRMRNVLLDGRITADFDGFLEIALTLLPFWEFASDGQNIPRLTGLSLDLPVKKEFSGLFHFWPNDTNSLIPGRTVTNSGAVTHGLSLPFKPYVWIGNEFRGLGISMESDESLQLSGPFAEYLVSPEETVLRIHLLDSMPEGWQGRPERWVETLDPVDLRLGFMATPTKKEDRKHREDWKVFHAFGDMHIGDRITYLHEFPGVLEHLAKSGVKWVIFHESSSVIQNYGQPDDPERFRALIDACHRHGMKTMMYFGYEYSSLAPDWYEKAGEYLIRTPAGHYAGGWQRKPWQRDFMVCYHGGYAPVMRDRVRTVMDEFGVDGIYTDGTFVPWECANACHGCGYTDRDGVRHATYPIGAVREHVRELYRIVHERGGYLDTHQSSCCLAPTLSFCDSYYDGENIQGGLSESLKNGLVSFLDLPAFRCEYMGKNLGIPDQFIAYSNPSVGWTIDRLCSLTLLHDVFPRPRQYGPVDPATMFTDLDYISRLWKLWDEYGLWERNWSPYWEKSSTAECRTDGAYLSLYEGEPAVGVLSNLTSEKKEVCIWSKASRAEDLMTGVCYDVSEDLIRISAESCVPILLAFYR